jgi:ketosteroid isomerase-like protein
VLIRLLALLCVSVVPAAAQSVDTAATKTSLMDADRLLASRVKKEGPQAFLAELQPNAAVLIPGQPILRGSAQSRKAFLARYSAPSALAWAPVHAVASTDGRFGCTVGFSRFTNAADTSHVERRGTYLTCWQRSGSGKWRIVGSQLNDSPGRSPILADSATMSFAPHSATVSLRGNGLRASQNADAAFAKMGSEPQGPGPAFVHYAATDAVMLGGCRFPHGLTGIAAAFDGFPADQIITWDPMRSFGAASGGLAFTVGHSVSGPRPGKPGAAELNKYMTIWRQNPDGRWVYIFDLGTSRK